MSQPRRVGSRARTHPGLASERVPAGPEELEAAAVPYPPEITSKIRRMIAERLEAGRLPREAAGNMYAGRGDGHGCHACDEAIGADQIEYEFDAVALDAREKRQGCAYQK